MSVKCQPCAVGSEIDGLGQSHLECERITLSDEEAQSDGKATNSQSDQAF